MKRLIILLSVLLLAGCPIKFYAIVDNRSGEYVEFISRNDAQTRDMVAPGETEKLHISRGCQLVKVGEFSGYLDFSRVPSDAWTSLDEGSKIQLDILYTNEGFSLKASSGNIYVIEVQESCYN